MPASDVIAEIGLDVSDMEKSLIATIARMDEAAAASEKLNDTLADAGGSAEVASESIDSAESSVFSLDGALAVASAGAAGFALSVATAALEADKAFQKTLEEFQKLRDALELTLGVTSMEGISSQLTDVESKAKSLIEGADTSGVVNGFVKTVGGIGKMMLSLGQARSQNEAYAEALKAHGEAYWLRIKAQQQFLTLGDEELELENAKLSGDKTAVALAEAKLDLKKKLVAIDQTVMDSVTKDAAKKTANEISGVKEEKIYKDRKEAAEKSNDEINKGLQKMVADKASADQKDVESANKAAEEKKKAAKKLSDFWAAMVKDDADVANRAAKKQQDEEGRAAKKKADDAKKAADKAAADKKRETDKAIKETEREQQEAQRLYDKIRNDRIEAYGGGTSDGRNFDKEEKDKEKRRRKGEKRLEDQERRDRERDEREQERLNPQIKKPAPIPKLPPIVMPGQNIPEKRKPEKPKPNGQPPPAPAPAPKGNRGNAMVVENLTVTNLKHA